MFIFPSNCPLTHQISLNSNLIPIKINNLHPSQKTGLLLKIVYYRSEIGKNPLTNRKNIPQNSTLTWADTNPDFTFCFKNTVLIWAPCLFVALFALLDVYSRSRSRYSDIPWSILNLSKSLVLLLLICLTFVDLSILLSSRSDTSNDIEIYNVQIVSVAIKAATFVSLFLFSVAHCLLLKSNRKMFRPQILVAFLQLMHKMKGHMSSGLLFNFWLVLVIFAVPQLMWELRNYDSAGENSWEQFQYVNYIIYFSLISIMLFLNCFADKKPRHTTYAKSDNPSPEQSSSFLRQLFFQWFDHTTWVGYKRPLTEKDIYDINPDDASRELVPPFDKYFAESVEDGQR